MRFDTGLSAATVEQLQTLLRESDISPVLVDVGCSGTRHAIWDPIAACSVLIGFDPDSRDVPAEFGQCYKSVFMIDRAVCEYDEMDQVEFVLTRLPSCCSTLDPDLESLRDYICHDYFLPIDKTSAKATSLNRVITEQSLQGIDWLKVDSQGTDLRIVRSLRPEYFAALVALDVEPGFIHAYLREDLFTDVHDFLTQNGFWLSDLHCQAYPRVRSESLAPLSELAGYPQDTIRSVLRGSPTAAEARYLRTIPAAAAAGTRQLLMLSVFALIDGHVGIAFEAIKKYEQVGGRYDQVALMKQIIGHELQKACELPAHRELTNTITHQLVVRMTSWYGRLGPRGRYWMRRLYKTIVER